MVLEDLKNIAEESDSRLDWRRHYGPRVSPLPEDKNIYF
jgi:hypothetical protein